MCYDWAESFIDFFRGNCFIYSIFLVPFLIAISPKTPVFAAHEFTVYRMQHFDLHGIPHGCRSSVLNLEARTLYTTPYTRRCVVARISELTPALYQEVLRQNAGALLLLIPQNHTAMLPEELEVTLQLERHMLEEEVTVPVYFAAETEELKEMYSSMSQHVPLSAAHEIPNSIITSGYQMVVTGPGPTAQVNTEIISIQGKLCGFGVEEQLPTVAIVAHYDSFGIAPGLSFGGDSNGSGVAALIELSRLLSRLYTNSRTHPRFNLLFLLSGGGKFNYQGTKKWIEDNVDSSDSSLLPDALYTLCLDSIGDDDHLYLHVSKPPKEGSPGDIFYKALSASSEAVGTNLSLVHKRINLAEERLAWEHERFSIRRLPAFTLSRLASSRHPNRNTLLDKRQSVNVDKLARNVKTIAEALARHMYNLSEGVLDSEVFTDGLSVHKEYLSAWVERLCKEARGQQLLSSAQHPLLVAMEQAMARYLKDVKVSIFKPDKREPELMFYEPSIVLMNAYRVKPAVFDLFLAVVIGAYLGLVYLLVTNFFRLERIVQSFSAPAKVKHN